MNSRGANDRSSAPSPEQHCYRHVFSHKKCSYSFAENSQWTRVRLTSEYKTSAPPARHLLNWCSCNSNKVISAYEMSVGLIFVYSLNNMMQAEKEKNDKFL
jgi:hypothetical protein